MAQAAIPIALLAVGTGLNAASAYGQIDAANRSRDLQLQQIRMQQVQLRLQENQESIERYKNLRKILATEQVQIGARNISPSSGSVRAIVNQNFVDFEEDQTASRLNYLSKQVGLDVQAQGVRNERNARVQQAVLGFGKDTVGLAMSFYGMPSGSLVDRSAPQNSPFNINRSA